jgi:hypothetical protein
MKNFYRTITALLLIAAMTLSVTNSYAGNKDRSGQAGAPELLINPWARGSGWASANTSSVMGLESMFTNVAGLAFTKKTELIFSYTDWLRGTDISIANFGVAQKLGESNVLGISVQSMSFGQLNETTTDQPEGTGATFSPNLLNVNIAFAKSFSNSISAGLTFKVINHSIPDAAATGIALDAGVIYVTGEKENIRFGVVLRNIGPKMKFTGDGFSIKALFESSDYALTVQQRSESFELPTQLRIGASYDVYFKDDISRISFAGTFVSNSFTKDQFLLGAEFNLRDYFMLRAGYTYESNITESIELTERTNVYNGPSVGATVQIPFSKENHTGLAIDYSYQTTAHFKGTHVIGIKFAL